MKVDFNVSGWDKDQTYEKFDVVFFSGDPETGCNSLESGYYYATTQHTSTTDTTLSPTGVSAKWTRSFPSTPSYNSSVSFSAKTFKNTFGDGYYSLLPKSHNNLKIQYDLNFNGRTEKESKAILHFLGHRFEEPYTGAAEGIVGALPNNATEYQSENILTGFNFTPFAPYNQTGTFFCEEFAHQQAFTNVHDVSATFNNDETSLTNWREQVIPLDNTAKYWAAGQTYDKFDIVYYSGHDISNHSGYYYNSGDSDEVTATTANGPVGANSLWTKDVFYFKPSNFSIPQEPRFLKSELNREYIKRWNDGINTNLLNINLNFEGKSEKEAKAITHFLINKKGYESFKFSPPKPYNQSDKIFVCNSWTDDFIFSDNRSLTASFQEMPIDLTKVKRNFRTYILDTNGSIIAPYEKQNSVDGSVFNINYGMFMTGFASGTGFYLLNSGDQPIISTLSLTGHHAKSGVYKFKENSDKRYTIDGGNSATFSLDQKDSGYFEVEFATTGKSGARGSYFTDDLDTEGYFFYFSGHGGAGYTCAYDDGWPRPSQLTVTSADQYGYDDPSGVLKIDLTGNAEALDPGPIVNFKVQETESQVDFFITGGWAYAEPLTATGITLEVSGTAPNAAAADPHGATGLLVDEPTSTTGFSYAAIPGRPRYFRIRTQNIDLIGGNIHGGEARTVNSSEWIHANETVANTALNVGVFKKTNLAKHTKTRTLSHENARKNVNLRTEAENELTRLQTLNPELTIDVFSKIRFFFGSDMVFYSADPQTPAVTTSTKFTSNYGAGLDPVPIELYIPRTTSIIGAGGEGAEVTSLRQYGVGSSTNLPRIECPVAFIVDPSQKTTLSGAHVKYCSLPELSQDNIGPISSRYLSGKMDGSYVCGNAPGNGEDGGTALFIHSDYAGSTVRLANWGFIGGGGGGGGAGGTRVSNITSLAMPPFGDNRDTNFQMVPYQRTMGVVVGEQDVSAFFKSVGQVAGREAYGGTWPEPSLQNRILFHSEIPDFQNDKALDANNDGWIDNTVVFEARPGGGGAAGQGLHEQTHTFVKNGIIVQDVVTRFARGGGGCAPFLSIMNVHGNRTIEVLQPSAQGASSAFSIPLGQETKESRAVFGGGAGAASPEYGEQATYGEGLYLMQNPSGLIVSQPNQEESMRNAGGRGGHGGGFGQDGQNGEHPVQNYQRRYISSDYGPEPRTFGFGGTGGLCIDANGALIDFIGGDIPCSGHDWKTEQDNKNSEFYRNAIGRGRHLTPKYKSSTTISASGHFTIGYISGLKGTTKADGTAGDTIDYGSIVKSDLNVSNAISDTGAYPAWKAFNQRVNGDFDDYVLMDQGGFPYYLIYDFGAGNGQKVDHYTITSAGASAEYFSEEKLERVYGEVFSPVSWKLFGSNASSDQLLSDSDMTLLSHMRVDQMGFPRAQIAPEGSSIRNADNITSFTDPTKQLEPKTVEGHKHNSYVCVPGATRGYKIDPRIQGTYRYYILKILSADGNQGKVKIADFGLRAKNSSYAGFISVGRADTDTY